VDAWIADVDKRRQGLPTAFSVLIDVRKANSTEILSAGPVSVLEGSSKDEFTFVGDKLRPVPALHEEGSPHDKHAIHKMSSDDRRYYYSASVPVFMWDISLEKEVTVYVCDSAHMATCKEDAVGKIARNLVRVHKHRGMHYTGIHEQNL
jgi:hypothetical protein